jgi:hypothetical protein
LSNASLPSCAGAAGHLVRLLSEFPNAACSAAPLLSADLAALLHPQEIEIEKESFTMSTSKKIESTETAVVPAGSYTAIAQERIEELRRWREQIPHFAIPASADATQRLSRAASLPPEFIELTSVATANHRPLVRAEARTPDEVRDLASYGDAFAPLPDELEALAKFIRYSTTAARNTAGREALTTYSLAARLAKQPETAYLAPHVDDMRRALGRGRKTSPEVLAKRAAARAAKAAAKAGTAPQPGPEVKPQP